LTFAVSPDERGGSRSSRTRGGMRWTRSLRQTSASVADGEAVWSWRPDAGVKFAGNQNFPLMMVAKEPGHQGELGISRNPSRRESRMPPLDLYARVRCLLPICTRDRGCSAHPAFPAPSCFEGGTNRKNLGLIKPRDRESVCRILSASLRAQRSNP
jgi:hypothetical protein